MKLLPKISTSAGGEAGKIDGREAGKINDGAAKIEGRDAGKIDGREAGDLGKTTGSEANKEILAGLKEQLPELTKQIVCETTRKLGPL